MVSPPAFELDPLTLRKLKPWPIHELLDRLCIDSPTLIPQVDLYLLAVFYLRKVILGSSASSLYKTKTLKKLPFPEDYGPAGDSAWTLKYNYQVSIGFAPKCISSFLIHNKPNPIAGERGELETKLLELVQETIDSSAQNSPVEELIRCHHQRIFYERRLNIYRKKLKRLKRKLADIAFGDLSIKNRRNVYRM